MNSNNFLITVLRKFQFYERKLGYCITTYIMFDATTALLSLPFKDSVNASRSLITLTRNFFSYSEGIEPEIEPMA